MFNNIITSGYVKLNVGGMLFHTTISTLTKFKNNMLSAMFSGLMVVTIDKDGWVIIDRSGKHFGVILNFLRDGYVPLPNLNRKLAKLRAEANFYCISELVELCDQALAAPINIHDIGPSFITALVEPLDKRVIQNLTKPAVILEIINKPKKYPKTNVELFDKLALSFHKQILFIRYFVNSHMSHWKFFKDGKQLQQIFCSSSYRPDGQIHFALPKLLQSLIPES